MNRAILGEEGGKGTMWLLAKSVASRSTPAKTVTKLVGFASFDKDKRTAGLALAAAQPQTEFTTTNVVPSFFKADSTWSGVVRSSKPREVNSAFIGSNISLGYIFFYVNIIKKLLLTCLYLMSNFNFYDKVGCCVYWI